MTTNVLRDIIQSIWLLKIKEPHNVGTLDDNLKEATFRYIDRVQMETFVCRMDCSIIPITYGISDARVGGTAFVS